MRPRGAAGAVEQLDGESGEFRVPVALEVLLGVGVGEKAFLGLVDDVKEVGAAVGVAVGSDAEVDFVGGGVLGETTGEGEDGIDGDGGGRGL